MYRLLLAFTALLPASAMACAPLPDIGAELDHLHERIATSPSAAVAQGLTGQLWQQWLKAPDAKAQTLLGQGMRFREIGDLLAAEGVLSQLIDYCPDYAEGYNQRAFARYLSGDYKGAVPDLERTLALRPRHLGALSGLALTYVAMGLPDRAIPLVEQMVALNPWASERHMLKDLGTEL